MKGIYFAATRATEYDTCRGSVLGEASAHTKFSAPVEFSRNLGRARRAGTLLAWSPPRIGIAIAGVAQMLCQPKSPLDGGMRIASVHEKFSMRRQCYTVLQASRNPPWGEKTELEMGFTSSSTNDLQGGTSALKSGNPQGIKNVPMKRNHEVDALLSQIRRLPQDAPGEESIWIRYFYQGGKLTRDGKLLRLRLGNNELNDGVVQGEKV